MSSLNKGNPITKEVYDWADENLEFHESPDHKKLERLTRGGQLLKAEEFAKEIEKKVPQSHLETRFLVKKVIERLERIREWNKTGKPSAFGDPPDWWDQPKFDLTCRLIEEHLATDSKCKSILDVGCFSGYFLREFQEHCAVPFSHRVGIDFQQDLLDFNRTNFPEIRWVFRNIEEMASEFTPGDFDVVTIFDVLEHVFNHETVARTVKKLVKPGGLVIVNVPKGSDYNDDSGEHLRIYEAEDIAKMFEGITFFPCKDEHKRPTVFGVWKA